LFTTGLNTGIDMTTQVSAAASGPGVFSKGGVIFPASLSHHIEIEASRLSKAHLSNLACTSPPCVACVLEMTYTLTPLSKKSIFNWCTVVEQKARVLSSV